MRLDGVSQFIMYGTGSHCAHNIMALRFDGELYMLESVDGWYWPIRRIQRNRWSEWIKYAEEADYSVVYMPLSDEKRKIFNETAAQEFFYKTQGLPYGFHNILSSFYDTAYDNLPIYLPPHLLPVMFTAIEDYFPDVVDIYWA